MAIVPFRERELSPGQKVRVYKNLHNDKFSIMDYSSGLVVAHADFVLLHDAHFLIRKSGQLKAKKEGIRNVHAFAVGSFISAEKCRFSNWDEFTYNPFQHDHFVDRISGYSLDRAAKVYMSENTFI